MTSQTIHSIVHHIINICLYAYICSFIYSINEEASFIIGGLFFIRFLAKELYVYENYKKEQEIIDEFDRMLNLEKKD